MFHKFSSISFMGLGFVQRMCTERLWVLSDKAFSFVWHSSWHVFMLYKFTMISLYFHMLCRTG